MSDYSSLRALVVGAGSIGRRHTRNLAGLGVRQLAVCDPDSERPKPLVEELNVDVFADYAQALAEYQPDIVLICTPPVFHIPQATQAVTAGADVFLEKPISNQLEGVDALAQSAANAGRIVQVGYNLRFHPVIQKVKSLLEDGTVGRLLWASLEIGQYLPDWRPWQDYRQSYTANSSLGGGIILDASHELDYALYLLGEPLELTCMAGHVSPLEVNVEDTATILMRFVSGAQADIHLDFIQRSASRRGKFVCESGTVEADLIASSVRVYQAESKTWETFNFTFDANEMYVAEMHAFLEVVARRGTPSVTLADGERVLQVALAAHQSAAQKTWVPLR